MRWLLIAALFFLAPLRADAKDEPCTNGIDCLCDCYADTDGPGNNVGGSANQTCFDRGVPIRIDEMHYCEDFEDDLIHVQNAGCPAGGRGYWNTRHQSSGISSSCDQTSTDPNNACCVPGGDFNQSFIGTGHGDRHRMTLFDGEGDCLGSSPPGDEAMYTDCIFQGGTSQAERFMPAIGSAPNAVGHNPSFVGTLSSRNFSDPSPHWGVTIAMKWNGDFVAPPDCTDSQTVALKSFGFGFNRAGSSMFSDGFLGSSTFNCGGPGRFPWGASMHGSFVRANFGTGGGTNATCVAPPTSGQVWDWRGKAGFNPSVAYYPDERAEWICQRIKVSNFRSANTNYRAHIARESNTTEVLAYDVDADTSNVTGWVQTYFNGYYNNSYPTLDQNSNGGGYCSSAVRPGFRLHDNLVIVQSDTGPIEPVSCAEIGFGEVGPPPYQEIASADAAVPEQTAFDVTCTSLNNNGAVTRDWDCDGDNVFGAECQSVVGDTCTCPGITVTEDTQITVGCEGTDQTPDTAQGLRGVTILNISTPSPPTASGAILGELNEPDEDVGNNPLESLEGCTLYRTFQGDVLDPLAVPATSVAGGGTIREIDVLPEYPEACDGQVVVTGNCTNEPGSSEVTFPVVIALPDCGEQEPKPPVLVP